MTKFNTTHSPEHFKPEFIERAIEIAESGGACSQADCSACPGRSKYNKDISCQYNGWSDPKGGTRGPCQITAASARTYLVQILEQCETTQFCNLPEELQDWLKSLDDVESKLHTLDTEWITATRAKSNWCLVHYRPVCLLKYRDIDRAHQKLDQTLPVHIQGEIDAAVARYARATEKAERLKREWKEALHVLSIRKAALKAAKKAAKNKANGVTK